LKKSSKQLLKLNAFLKFIIRFECLVFSVFTTFQLLLGIERTCAKDNMVTLHM